MIRCVVLIPLLTGCDALFQLGEVPTIDAAKDSMSVQDSSPSSDCVSVPTYQDTFDNSLAQACSLWGIYDAASASVTVANGQLTITPFSNVQDTRGGCESSNPAVFPASGFFAQVTQPNSGGSEFMEFCTYDTTTTMCVKWVPGLVMFGSNQITFDAQLTQWVRLRPSVDRSAMVAETSADAHSWTVLGTAPYAVPAALHFSALFGTYAPEASPSTARFDTINVCP